MPNRVTGAVLIKRWEEFYEKHRTYPCENGKEGSSLAVFTRHKVKNGSLKRTEIKRLQQMKKRKVELDR